MKPIIMILNEYKDRAILQLKWEVPNKKTLRITSDWTPTTLG